MPVAAPIERLLRRERMPYTTFRHPPAYSAQAEAEASHVSGRDWAKVVVCVADGEAIQAVVPAHLTVDLDRLRTVAGAESVRLAAEEELGCLYPGCELGAMSPLGPVYGQPVFVDEALAGCHDIVFSAGSHADSIRMHFFDFAEITRAVIGSFARSRTR